MGNMHIDLNVIYLSYCMVIDWIFKEPYAL